MSSTASATDIGRTVIQYDYVEKREARGIITAWRTEYSFATDADIDIVVVQWSEQDGGVATRHDVDALSAIAGRDELRLADNE